MDNRTLEEVRKNETKLIEEIKSLEKQLKYLRSGEYYNQLRFENEMLQQVVDTNGVPSEVYDYIDCTHRNTELLEENQKLKDRDLIIAAELTKLQQENKILKENAENNDKVVDKVNWENQSLKKQLEDKTEDYKRMKDNFDSKVDVLTKIATQQKEFINWLEENYETTQDIWYIKILNKYKAIRGEDK